LKEAVKGESSQATLVELVRDEDFKTTSLIAYDVDKLLEFEDTKSNPVTLEDDELYISKKLSDKYGIKKGDTLKWRIYGEDQYYEDKVYCIINSPIEQGIFITKKHLDQFSMDYVPTTIYTNENVADIKAECIKSITSVQELKKQNNKAIESFRLIINVMVIAAIALGLVVLYNLGMLSYNERFRELATLKVLGFSDKALNLLNVTQTLSLSIFGIIIGIPLGRLFAEYMFNSIDGFPFKVTTTAISMGFSVGGVLLVILTVCIILSKKIKEVDMVVSLKMND
jgi:putative ABC transport system permease protein